MNQKSAFIEEAPAIFLPPGKDTSKRWPSVNQEAGPQQTVNLSAP